MSRYVSSAPFDLRMGIQYLFMAILGGSGHILGAVVGAALVTLFALYVLLPSIADGLGLKQALVLFYPQVSAPLWVSPAVAWAEALVVAGLAVGRIAVGVRREVAAAAATA